MNRKEMELALEKDHREAICRTVYGWLEGNKIKPSDLTKVITEFYRKECSNNLEKPFEVLDGLDGWCIDDELAINWGIHRLYTRFSNYQDKESAKNEATEIAQQLVDHFKNNGGNEDVKNISKGNS